MPNDSICKKTHILSGLMFFISTLLASCSDPTNSPTISNASKPSLSIKQEEQTPLTNKQNSPEALALASIIDEHFAELTNRSKQVNELLIAFTQKPSKVDLQTVTEALDKLHALFVSGYFLDASCRIYSPNLTTNESDLTKLSIKTKLDQQPLLPGYLDAVEGYPFSGLIYSDIPITRKSMEQEFQLGDPAYVSLGFHALDLILKGSNLNRKVSDFSPLKSTKDTSSAPAELRRTLYAILLASEIENDISILKSFWDAGSKNHLDQKSQTQANYFFDELYITAEKELSDIQNKETTLEENAMLNEHSNIEIIKLKKALLERLISIKELRTKI